MFFFFLIYNKDLQKRKLKKPSEFNVKSNFQLPRIQPFLPNACVWPLLKNSQADGRRAGQENMEAGPVGWIQRCKTKGELGTPTCSDGFKETLLDWEAREGVQQSFQKKGQEINTDFSW